jgi:hypothetical protein
MALHKVMGAFIEAFAPAYRPLLSSIKAVLDAAVARGAGDAAAAARLRREVLRARRGRAAAGRAARARALGEAAAAAAPLRARAAAATARAEAARARVGAARRELLAAAGALELAQGRAERGRAAAARLAVAAAADAAWRALPGAAALGAALTSPPGAQVRPRRPDGPVPAVPPAAGQHSTTEAPTPLWPRMPTPYRSQELEAAAAVQQLLV